MHFCPQEAALIAAMLTTLSTITLGAKVVFLRRALDRTKKLYEATLSALRTALENRS